MKILKGSLKETLYSWPEQDTAAPLTVKKETVYTENQVTYMSDRLGLHRISNPDPEDYAVSLHRRFPPLGTYTATDPGGSVHAAERSDVRLQHLR